MNMKKVVNKMAQHTIILSDHILLFFPLQTILIQNIYRNPQNSAQTADASRCKFKLFFSKLILCFLKVVLTNNRCEVLLQHCQVETHLGPQASQTKYSVIHQVSPNTNKKHKHLFLMLFRNLVQLSLGVTHCSREAQGGCLFSSKVDSYFRDSPVHYSAVEETTDVTFLCNQKRQPLLTDTL